MEQLQFIEQMERAQPVYRPDLPQTIPKMLHGEVEHGKIGRLIGRSGKIIMGIIETCLADVDVDRDTRKLSVAIFDPSKMQAAMDHIRLTCQHNGKRASVGARGTAANYRADGAGPASLLPGSPPDDPQDATWGGRARQDWTFHLPQRQDHHEDHRDLLSHGR